MSEFDELENMFSDAFSDEKVTPPKSVKQNIDRSLFGSNGRVIWLFALLLLLLLPIGGVLLYTNYSTEANGMDKGSVEMASNSIVDRSESSDQVKSLEPVSNQETDELLKEDPAKTTSTVTSTSSKVNFVKPYSGVDKEVEVKLKSEKSGSIQFNSSDTGSKNNTEKREEVEWMDHNMVDLLALTKVSDRPLPYDLLLMCATKPIQKRNPISLDLYTGVETGFSNYDYRKNVQPVVAMDRKLTEDLGVSLSIEASYPLNSRFSIASGFGVNRAINTFSRGTFGIDSTYTGDTLIITQYFDTVNQVQVVDSSYFATYDISEYELTETTQILRTSFLLPVYLKYERAIGLNWRAGASFGVRLSYDQITLRDNVLELSEKEFKRFGISAILRPEISYQLNQWNFGAYGQAGYDILHGLSGDLTRVRRYSFGGGLKFRYTF